MEYRQKILLVNILKKSVSALQKKGYDTLLSSDMNEAVELAASHCPDLVVLNSHLNDEGCSNAICEIRRWSDVPIMIMARDIDEQGIERLLDSGADDYVPHNISDKELFIRIKIALRKKVGINDVSGAGVMKQVIGSLTIDYAKYRAYLDGRDIGLTQNEFKILSLLGKNAGRVLTYDYIIIHLWGPNASGDNQILRVNMTNIRRKLGDRPSAPRYIFTESGVGYRLAEN